MQVVLYWYPAADPLEVAIYSIPVTLLISAASWSWIEKPSLAGKAGLGRWLELAFKGMRPSP